MYQISDHGKSTLFLIGSFIFRQLVNVYDYVSTASVKFDDNGWFLSNRDNRCTYFQLLRQV